MNKMQNIINSSHSGIIIFTVVSLIIIIVFYVICLVVKNIKTKEDLIQEHYIAKAFFPVIPIWFLFLIAYILFAIYADEAKTKSDLQQKIFLSVLTVIVAGLGIGGVAVALAAQDTLSNILGCVIILLDKPFAIGQRIKVLDYDGVIEYVGIRSTKLRTLEDNVVIIPNRNIASANIENVNARNNIKQLEDISLSPEISSETVRIIIENIKEILKEDNSIRDDYGVFFDKRDAVSVNLKMWYWVNTTDYLNYMKTKENVNYKISNMLEKIEVKYAMPRTTVFLKDKEELI